MYQWTSQAYLYLLTSAKSMLAKYQKLTCKKLRVRFGISSRMPLIEDRGVSELTDMEVEASEEMSESVRKTFTNYIDKYKVKSSPLKD